MKRPPMRAASNGSDATSPSVVPSTASLAAQPNASQGVEASDRVADAGAQVEEERQRQHQPELHVGRGLRAAQQRAEEGHRHQPCADERHRDDVRLERVDGQGESWFTRPPRASASEAAGR